MKINKQLLSAGQREGQLSEGRPDGMSCEITNQEGDKAENTALCRRQSNQTKPKHLLKEES